MNVRNGARLQSKRNSFVINVDSESGLPSKLVKISALVQVKHGIKSFGMTQSHAKNKQKDMWNSQIESLRQMKEDLK